MSKTNITIGFWIPTQVLLLVLYYGGILPSLPWWVVWFPSLIVLGLLAVWVMFIVIILLIALIATMFG